MSIRAATSVLKGRLRTFASHAIRRHQSSTCYPDLIQSVTFDREVIAAKAVCDRTGEPFVNEYKLLPNYIESSSRRNVVSADDNDDTKPLYFMRDVACFTALDTNLSPLYDIFPRFPHPFSKNDYYSDNSERYGYCSSSNGLFCFQEERISLVWNPATDEFKLLPESEPDSATLNCTAIWFDPKSEDYKLMRLCNDFHHDGYEIELYSFKTDSWKKISCPDDIGYASRGHGVCINGVFYNIVASLEREGQRPIILSFDFSTETTCILPAPPSVDNSDHLLLDYNGLLSVLAFDDDNDTPSNSKSETRVYQLWVLRDGSWDLVSLYHACAGGAGDILYPQAFSRNGELLFFKSYRRVFDSATGKLKRLDDRPSTNGVYHRDIIPFSESFVKLKR